MVLIAIDPNEQYYLPEVSIVIAARNCENALSDTLQSINELYYPKNKIEIIVVDDASTDNTAAVADVFDVVVIRRNSRGGCSGARNTGILNSSKNIIAFIDADCIVTKNWLKTLLQPFKDDLVWATGGFINNIIYKGNNLSKFIQLDLEYRKRSINPKSVPGSNSAFRKMVFKELGLLNIELEGAEDAEISYRILNAGYKLIFVEDAIIYHPFPSDIITYFKKGINYAKNRTLMYAKGKHLIKNDEHTPWNALIQPILPFFILFIAFIFSLYKAPIIFYLLIMTSILVLNFHLIYLIMRNDISIVIHAILYILIRTISWTIGMINAGLLLLFAILVNVFGGTDESQI